MKSPQDAKNLLAEGQRARDAESTLKDLDRSQLRDSRGASSCSYAQAADSDAPDSDPKLELTDHLLSGAATPGYRLLDLPLNGAMGVVYRAWNEKLQRVVALKLSTLDVSAYSAKTRERQLKTEATNLARIEHANIARCYGYGSFGRHSWVEMQWVNGVTFEEVIKFVHAPHSVHKLDDDCLFEWMLTLVDSLNFCQHRGVHHLDLKPSNLMLTCKSSHISEADSKHEFDSVTNAITNCDHEAVSREEFQRWCRRQEVCVLDFGIARRGDPNEKIETGAGSPLWMAPEQICRVSVKPSLIDQYGIGGILYACMTGRPPNGNNHDAFARVQVLADAAEVCDRPLPSSVNRSVNRDIEAIALKCLQFHSPQRYETLDDLREDIVSARALRTIQARSLSPPERLTRYIRREPWSFSTISILSAALMVTLVLVWSLVKVSREAVLARENDRQTFRNAISGFETIEQLYRVDPQLNRPENRELATRVKAKLFELYQPFLLREGLDVADRRLLALRSEEVAREQKKRGDYNLAAKFYEHTVNQYHTIRSGNNAVLGDHRTWCMASVDLLRAQASVTRKLYPSADILRRSEALIRETRLLDCDETLLYVLANHCRLRLILEGRVGPRNCYDKILECESIINRLDSPTPELAVCRARSLFNVGRVRYKGSLEGHTGLLTSSIELYRDLIDRGSQSSELTIECVYAVATLCMSKVTHIKLTDSGLDPSQQVRDLEPVIAEVESDYNRALALVDSQSHVDLLNNELLQCKCDLQWMVADFCRRRT